eukprot:755126-Hanusia_phi.AAC.1
MQALKNWQKSLTLTCTTCCKSSGISVRIDWCTPTSSGRSSSCRQRGSDISPGTSSPVPSFPALNLRHVYLVPPQPSQRAAGYLIRTVNVGSSAPRIRNLSALTPSLSMLPKSKDPQAIMNKPPKCKREDRIGSQFGLSFTGYILVADYPNLFRMWIDARRKPMLESKVEAFGAIDIWSLPGMKYIQNIYVSDLIFDFFPMKIDISDPDKLHEKSKGAVSRDLFAYLSTKGDDYHRSASLCLELIRISPIEPPQTQDPFLCIVSHGSFNADDEDPEERKLQSSATYYCCTSQHATRKGWLLKSMLLNIQDPFKEILRIQVFSLSVHQVCIHGRPLLQTSMSVSDFLDRQVIHRKRRHLNIEQDGFRLELNAEDRTAVGEESTRVGRPPMGGKSGAGEGDWLVVILDHVGIHDAT